MFSSSLYSSMSAGMSSIPTSRAPVILLYNKRRIVLGVPYRSQACDVKTFPSDFEIFFPPLSRNISYFTCVGAGKFRISSDTQSFTFTESMISLPYASNLISKALHLAANSTFHGSLPKSFVMSAIPSCPQPFSGFEPIVVSAHLYLIFFSSAKYSYDIAVYNLPQFAQTGKYGSASWYFSWPTISAIFSPIFWLFVKIV